MHTIRVESVEEAVREAERRKSDGRAYWFRGQAKNWPVRSSAVRLDAKNRELVSEKIRRYGWWIENTPGLENLATDIDTAVAVAQHYGIPTNFIDFTTHPEIAGFFASEKANSDTADDGCIVCVDVEDFKDFWRRFVKDYTPPEFLELTVPDLWRLEAQYGCFLFCPYDEVEFFYDFDRILFPNTHPLHGVRREDVYPVRKSQLEVLLDQYFMNERLVEGDAALATLRITPLIVEAPSGGCDPEVFPNGLPQHASWADNDVGPWLELRAEPLHQVRTSVNFRIIVPNPEDTKLIVRAVSNQLLNDLFALAGIRGKLVGWQAQTKAESGLPSDFESRLAAKLANLWDGLRRLPYTDEDIAVGVGQCVAFAVALGGAFRNPDHQHWERAAHRCLVEPIELEFAANDGSYSRAYASKSGLAVAIRPDILSYVADQWREPISENVCRILQLAWTPQKTFDFGLLTTLFAREIAPYQVLARNTAIFYSPARLVSLGLP